MQLLRNLLLGHCNAEQGMPSHVMTSPVNRCFVPCPRVHHALRRVCAGATVELRVDRQKLPTTRLHVSLHELWAAMSSFVAACIILLVASVVWPPRFPAGCSNKRTPSCLLPLRLLRTGQKQWRLRRLRQLLRRLLALRWPLRLRWLPLLRWLLRKRRRRHRRLLTWRWLLLLRQLLRRVRRWLRFWGWPLLLRRLPLRLRRPLLLLAPLLARTGLHCVSAWHGHASPLPRHWQRTKVLHKHVDALVAHVRMRLAPADLICLVPWLLDTPAMQRNAFVCRLALL